MVHESGNQALRQVRTLYALGAVGRLTDIQLIERFLGGDGDDREDAFAALVQRHGPMVLRVCNRMLPGSADAEDAFQAVFLVLARKAGSVHRFGSLDAWLYGVAVRAAREAKRKSARRLAREATAMSHAKAVSTPEEGRGELLTLLDEEINRLPGRYRDPLRLCDLEGTSRQDASKRLGVPEGTLSSRLARGRSLLRDRLVRRGVAPALALGASVIPDPTNAATLPEALADTTVRLALSFAAGGATAGTVPAAVASLAEGVIGMLSVAKLKLILAVAALLGASAGLATAFGPDQTPPSSPERPTPTAQANAAAELAPRPKTSPYIQVRGRVFDEDHRPVAGAEVLVDPFNRGKVRGISGPDGSFTITTRYRRIGGTALLARSPTDDRVGVFRYDFFRPEPTAQLELKPIRTITVRVTDASRTPVAGATVEAAAYNSAYVHAITGPDGSASIRIPTGVKIEWIIALKPGQGFDYAEFGPHENELWNGGTPAPNLPESVTLTLDGARVVRIQAVDAHDKALAGVEFHPLSIKKEGRQTEVSLLSKAVEVQTGADGIATFDWLPTNKQPLLFRPSDEFALRLVPVDEEETEIVTTRVDQLGTIRGRVVRPDGSPASGIVVHAQERAADPIDQAQSRTTPDGSYELEVNTGEIYAVFVEDTDWAAPSRLDVKVRDGNPIENVDFRLERGTTLQGRITVGLDKRPVSSQLVTVIEEKEATPEQFRNKDNPFERTAGRKSEAYSDEDGRYAFRLSPGNFTLLGPPGNEDEHITIKDQDELVRDFRVPRSENDMITGRVVLGKSPVGFDGHRVDGIAGARVEIVTANLLAIPFTVIADAEGRFGAKRASERLVICAKNPDGTLGGIVEAEPNRQYIDIAVSPTATATGLLVDESGDPAPNLELYWGRRVFLGQGENSPMIFGFAPNVVTDREGRFTLPSLVVGEEYHISVLRGNQYAPTGAVQPETPGPIDLGTLRIGAYRPPPAEALSSFGRNAPGAGQDVPPLKATSLDGKPLTLDDFKGKLVLLHFWATWSGPCIDDILWLQAIHEDVKMDERFAILSVSVDESIEEANAFQKSWKLHWSQAHLAGGIHGPTPSAFGIRAVPACILVGPDGKIIARGMRGEAIKAEVDKALAKRP